MAGSLIGPAKYFFTLAKPIMAQPKIDPAIIGPANFFEILAKLFFDWVKNDAAGPAERAFPQH